MVLDATAGLSEPYRRSRLDRLTRHAEPYLYAAPALILIVTIMLAPLVLGLSYAFRDVQLLNPLSGGYVGLDHFRSRLRLSKNRKQDGGENRDDRDHDEQFN